MSFYLSPIVDVNEIDLSTTIPAVATSIAAIILRDTYKGPERKKTLITSEDTLIDTFGEPTNTANCYQDIMSALGYLKYGNKLYCTRTMPVSAAFAGIVAVSGAEATFTEGEAYQLTDFNSEDPDEFAEEEEVTGIDSMYFIAKSRGAWGNNIKLAIIDNSTYSAIASGGHSDWDTYADLASIDNELDSDDEFLVAVSVQKQGQTSYTLVENFNVSTRERALDDLGISKFCETVINGNSKYIRMSLNAVQKNEDITISTSSWQALSGGVDDNGDTVTDGDIELDLDMYKNPEEIDINMFIDSNKSNEVKRYIEQICSVDRKDSMAILDCSYSDVVNNVGSEATALRTYARTTLNTNSSYAALYGNWLNVYDKWNNKYKWIPTSGYLAGIFANTDDTNDPWFAPAGLNRGIIGGVRKLAWNPTLGERDILYKNGVNPIVSFAGQGKVVWGQKTTLAKSSAFNRINIRRLFLILEKAISTASKYFLFEPNDELSRILLVDMITPFLRDVRSRRGLSEYLVVCDSTNNTPERMDRNELWCDIWLKPTHTYEFIVLNFIATKTGVSFTEMIAATQV